MSDRSWDILHGDCRQMMKSIPDNSIDAIVTDPPYELGFMGRKWDSSGIAFDIEVWKQALRVLKPGGMLLAFSGTRTFHRMVVAIEDAGFEIRDQIAWLHGMGFPKSLDVVKAIDKHTGTGSKVVGSRTLRGSGANPDPKAHRGHAINEGGNHGSFEKEIPILAPGSEQSAPWAGWGTALKPAMEPVCMARKPLCGTVAANVLKHGTGGLNIDAARIGGGGGEGPGGVRCGNRDENGLCKGHDNEIYGRTVHAPLKVMQHQGTPGNTHDTARGRGVAFKGREDGSLGHAFLFDTEQGRWPANVCMDEEAADLLDEQAPDVGGVPVGKGRPEGQGGKRASGFFNTGAPQGDPTANGPTYEDRGGASRFFFVAKASTEEREIALDDLEAHGPDVLVGRDEDSAGAQHPRAGAGGRKGVRRKNLHPTVKPIDLMRWLVRLVCRKGGTVLDPFAGSGSTGVAALLEGCNFVGCELTGDYLPILKTRLQAAQDHRIGIVDGKIRQTRRKEQLTLF